MKQGKLLGTVAEVYCVNYTSLQLSQSVTFFPPPSDLWQRQGKFLSIRGTWRRQN